MNTSVPTRPGPAAGRLPSKGRTAFFSVLAAGGLAIAKLIAGLATGSLALLADALHSGLDVVASVITLFAVRLSDRPADENHPYGHARAENLGALAETILLTIMGTLVLAEAYRRLFVHPEPPTVTSWAFAVVLLAIAVDVGRVRALRRAARLHGSPALEANAAHFQNDLISSVLVLIALGMVAFGARLGLPPAITDRADAAGGALVALLAFRIALKLGWKAVNSLMDAIPPELGRRLGAAVESVEGVVSGSTRVRGRFLGEQPYVDVTLAVTPASTLEEAHAVTERVAAAIRGEHPRADVVVHVRPGALSPEEHVATVRAIANRMGLSVHHIDVLLLADGLRVDLDLELPPGLLLHQAHDRSEQLESALRAAMPRVRQIGVHLEPRAVKARPAARHPGTAARVRAALEGVIAASRIREVDVALTDEGAVVSLRLVFAADTPLEAVHDEMEEIEAALRAAVAGIARVRLDPEPA
jgi:cation diffusion facilitator family transporter